MVAKPPLKDIFIVVDSTWDDSEVVAVFWMEQDAEDYAKQIDELKLGWDYRGQREVIHWKIGGPQPEYLDKIRRINCMYPRRGLVG